MPACGAFLHPESGHRPKGVRTFDLKLVPAIEIGHGRVCRKAFRIFGARGCVKADERKSIRDEEFLNRRDGGWMFLDVKK